MTKNRLLFLAVLLLFSKTFGQDIEIVTQERIQGTITILTYSPDGKLIASGSERENSIKIWDVVSGKIIGKLEGHEAATTALQFNENGTALISAAMDKKVILWNLTNWKLIDSLTVGSPVKTFTNNPTSSTGFFSGDEAGDVFEWSQTSFKSPKRLYQQGNAISKLDFYNSTLVSGDVSGNLLVFDRTTLKKVIEKKIHLGTIIGLNFYNEGKGLITSSTNGKVYLWDLANLVESKSFDASNALVSAFDANIAKNSFVTVSQNTIKVWNLSGELVHEFKSKVGVDGEETEIKAIKISPDGSTMASSGFQRSPVRKTKDDKNIIRIWDLKRGTLYSSLKGTVNPIYSFDFHPEKNELITLGNDNILTFWNFNLAEKIGELKLQEPKREIAPLRLGGDKPGDIKIGDLNLTKGKKIKNTLKEIRRGNVSVLKDPGKTIGVGMAKRMFKERSIVKFSQKGKYLITKLDKDEIRLYEFENGIPMYKQPLFSYQLSINQLLTSPDEKYLAVLGAGDSAVSIIDLETKKILRKLSTPAPKDNFRFIYEANSLAFSPDGNLFAVCFNTGKTFVFNTSTWSLVFENILPDNLGYVESPFVNFSKDGKYMVVKSMLGLKKYDTETFNIFTSEPLKIDGYSAPMDKPQDYAITIFENEIYFENLFTGEVKKSIRVMPEQITHISINPSGLVGITFKSGQFILMDPKTGEEVVLLVADGDNYIFKTAENFYKVSKEGYDLVTFRIGNQAFPFEQFDAIFNRPDLVLKKLGCTDAELIKLYEQAYLRRIKKLGLQPTTEIVLADIPKTAVLNAVEIPAITEKPSVTVNLNLADNTSLKSYNIWVNNVPVHGKNGKPIVGKSLDITDEVSLVHGLNKIQIACRNAMGYESLIQTFYVEKTGPKPPQDLYLITIGTSTYKDTRYNLNYPKKDGTDLLELMQANTAGLYREVKTKSLFNSEVTLKNVELLKAFLKGTQPNDVVIVFVAGHGILDANFDYYFGTYDIDFSKPNLKGLAYEKLEQLLDGIKANRKILIMDTCHSGEVDKEDVFFVAETDQPEEDGDISFRAVGNGVEENKTNATPSRLAGELFNDLRKGTGATVISSAGGVEYAMESDEWKNGLFTYCMLNGLKNRTADLNGDGVIMLLELQAYIVEKVSALSHGRQVPNSRIQNIELDFPVW
jgi:WD40 repeat protein